MASLTQAEGESSQRFLTELLVNESNLLVSESDLMPLYSESGPIRVDKILSIPGTGR